MGFVGGRFSRRGSGRLRYQGVRFRQATGESPQKPVAMIFNYQFPDSAEGGHLDWGRSKRASAMTHKVITFEFVAPTVLAAALGTVLSIGAFYLTNRYLGPVDQSEANHSGTGSRGIAELPKPDARFSRVHLLLSGMR